MKGILMMAAAVAALSAASAASAQERDLRGYGVRPGQAPREQSQQVRASRGEQRGEGRRAMRGDGGPDGARAEARQQRREQAPALAQNEQRRPDRGEGFRQDGGGRPDRAQVQERRGRDGDGRSAYRPDGQRDGQRDWQRDGRGDGRPDVRRDDRRGDRGQWRGGDRHDYRQWRGHDRRGHYWPSQNRFRLGIYRAPYGYSYRQWTFGEYLPRSYYVQQYVLRDFWNYDLPAPPYGLVWIRYGSDALLIDPRTGYVEDAIYGIFW